MTQEATTTTTTTLTHELSKLPAQPVAAVRVLHLVEDPKASAADLARIIESDPALSARVMRLANAPYYGLARRVGSAGRAVVLLGFSTVRALAVSAACGLLGEGTAAGLDGFWVHSVASAAAASTLAQHAGYPTGDAFSAGMLHDIGRALLHQADPGRYAGVLWAARGSGDLLAAETAEYGTDHAAIGADVLDAWRFPPAFVRAVAAHHGDPEPAGDTLTRFVVAGEALAEHLEHGSGEEPQWPLEAALDAAGVPANRVPRLTADLQRELRSLASFLEL